MKKLKWLLAGVAIGVVAVAFRDLERGEWLRPQLPGRREPVGPEEPVLGYDGMDQETVLDWLVSADLDAETLGRILLYEDANLSRTPVIELLEEILG